MPAEVREPLLESVFVVAVGVEEVGHHHVGLLMWCLVRYSSRSFRR